MSESVAITRATKEQIEAARAIYENSHLTILDTARISEESSDGESLGCIWVEAWVRLYEWRRK